MVNYKFIYDVTFKLCTQACGSRKYYSCSVMVTVYFILFYLNE